jgi:hypothetical protein
MRICGGGFRVWFPAGDLSSVGVGPPDHRI